MPKKLRWPKSPTGCNGRPWKNWRLSRNRIRCWPGTESSSPTSSTDRSFANPGVVPELTRKPSGWWCGWRRKIPGGADRIVGAMANLGHRLSDQTVGNILRRHDIPPAPKRKQTTSWKDFIRAHMAVLVATDCRWRWKKGPKQRWSGYFSLCPFPSWKGVFSQNGPQRSRARRCCAAKRTLHGEDRSEILDKRERGGPKWTAKMAQSLTASDTRLRSKATASATPKSYACNRRSTLSKQTPGSAYSRLIRTSKIAYRP